MIASRRLLLVFIICTSWFIFPSYSQERKTIDLKEAIKIFNEKFETTFSYADQNIIKEKLYMPLKLSSVDEFLQQIEAETNLSFEVLSESSVVLKLKDQNTINCGYVVDLFTEEPIGTVLVNSGKYSTVTNDSGYFEFTNLIKEPLLFYHISYRSTQKEPKFIKVIPCNTIKMEPQISTLNAVEVNNFLTQGIDKRINGEFSVRPSILQIIPGLTEPDVLFTIQALPGISSVNESVSNINIRGGTNDQNLILWDGIRMYQSGHFYGLISAFNPYFTEEVALIKNGTSAKYGNGVSGTIAMESIENQQERIVAGMGSSMVSSDAFFHVPVNEKLNISFAGRRSISDWVTTPTYSRYYDRAFRFTDITSASLVDSTVSSTENFTFYDINAKATFRPNEKEKIKLTFLNLNNSLQHEESQIVNGQIEMKTSSLEQSSRAAGLTYTKLWSRKFRTNAEASFSSYRLEAVNFDIANNQKLDQGNEVLDYSVELNFRYAFNSLFDLFAGYKYNDLGVTNIELINNPAFSRTEKDVISSHVAFIEGSFSSADQRLNTRLGLRNNYFYQLNRFRAEPRLTVNYKLTDALSVELLGEQKNQVATQVIDLQNDFLGVEKRRWVLTNEEDIPLTTSNQISLGFHFNKNEFQLSTEVYTKQVKGIITSGQAFLNQFELIRSEGEYNVSGVDVLINKEFEFINSWLSYSFANNDYLFPDLNVQKFSSNLDVRHFISAGATVTVNDLVLSSGVSWNSGRPYTPFLANNPVTAGQINHESPNSARLADYARIDISGKYRFTLSSKFRAMVGFAVWNVLNRDNIINRYYQIDQNSGEIRDYKQKALEITPNLLVRVNFN